MLTPINNAIERASLKVTNSMDRDIRFKHWLHENNIYQVQGLVNLEELLTQQGFGR